MSLSPIFVLRRSTLVDTRLGAEHSLQPEARAIISRLIVSIQVRALQREHTPEALADVLGFINASGGLQRYRLPWSYLEVARSLITYPRLLRYPALKHRHLFTIGALAVSCWQATWLVYACGAMSTCLLALLGATHASSLWSTYAIACVIFYGSIFIHEAVHAFATARHGGTADIIQSGLQLQLWHKLLAPAAELWVAALGPLAGLAACLAAAWFCAAYHQGLIFWLACGIAALHVSCLLPWHSDGHSMYLAAAQRHRE